MIRKREVKVWRPRNSDMLLEQRKKKRTESAPSAKTRVCVDKLVKGLLGNSVVFYGCEVM